MKPVTCSFGIGVLLSLTAGSASSQTVTVTIPSPDVDVDYWTATIDDLPGPDGEVSFPEALIATNNTPGHQTIGFAIPTSLWELQFAYPGRAVIMGGNLHAFDEVTIDGTTQTDFTGDTNPDGWEVAIYGATLYLNGDNSTLLGFDSSPVSVSGSNSMIHSNSEMNITVYGGSNGLVQGNSGGTIKIDRSNDNLVIGNTVQRVRVLGWVGGGMPATNNRIGGPALADRNYITGYGTWNGEGLPGGTTVQIFDSIGTLVENNWIGTTPDGLEQGSLASVVGIGFEGENYDTIIRNNRIAGILGHGQGPHHAGQLFGRDMYFNGSGSGFIIVGNTFGLDANEEPVLGSVYGIDVGYFNFSGISNVQIGGSGPGDGNIIAGHLFNGITVQRDVQDVRISGNSIYANQELGIDLVPEDFGYGVTPNDTLDADIGGNGLQNFPELASATVQGSTLEVIGSLHSSALSDFTIEIFASPTCDASGHGEGELFLAVTSVSTDAEGNADFDVLISGTVAPGWFVTSTATLEPAGATSEFSACVPVTGDALPGDVDGDGWVGVEDLLAVIAAWGSCAGCPEDCDGNGVVDITDLLLLLANWS